MKKVILLSLSILLISLGYSFAEVPCKINYQGRLIENNVPVDGTKKMKFSIYNEANNLLWTSKEVDITVYNGLFRYVLDLSSIDDWTAGEELYLEVQVGTDILTPREAIYAYPYAINSHLLEGATKEYFINTSGEEQTKRGNLNIMGNVGIGTVSPANKLDISASSPGAYTGIVIRDTDTNERAWSLLVSDNAGSYAPSKGFGIRDIHGGATRLVIDTSGNVGIGTTEPDATLHVKGTMKVFGAREARTKNTIYQAATDGFVTAWASDAIGGLALNVIGFTDSSPNPTTMVIIDTAERDRNVDWADISFPVKKDDYWKVKMDNGPEQDYGIYWIPFGN